MHVLIVIRTILLQLVWYDTFCHSFQVPKITQLFSGMNPLTSCTTGNSASGLEKIPLIDLPAGEEISDLMDVSPSLVNALRTSGFLLIQSPSLPNELQQSVIETTRRIFLRKPSGDDDVNDHKEAEKRIINHPTDPKVYMMIDSPNDIATKCSMGESAESGTSCLHEYWAALELVKRQILRCIAIGLELETEYFVKLHSKNQSVLRLLHYYPTERLPGSSITIRGKAHSDYGSITLLLTDGVPGLQAWIDEKWIPVPYVKGALVVNIGSLLQDWTQGQLLATLHRVISMDDEMITAPRTSLAFFADPDPDVCMALQETTNQSASSELSVADYIQWRSGGVGPERSGVSFSKNEEERAKHAG